MNFSILILKTHSKRIPQIYPEGKINLMNLAFNIS